MKFLVSHLIYPSFSPYRHHAVLGRCSSFPCVSAEGLSWADPQTSHGALPGASPRGADTACSISPCPVSLRCPHIPPVTLLCPQRHTANPHPPQGSTCLLHGPQGIRHHLGVPVCLSETLMAPWQHSGHLPPPPMTLVSPQQDAGHPPFLQSPSCPLSSTPWGIWHPLSEPHVPSEEHKQHPPPLSDPHVHLTTHGESTIPSVPCYGLSITWGTHLSLSVHSGAY